MRPLQTATVACYMQTCACMNAATTAPSDGAGASHRRPDAPLTRELTIVAESLADVQDEKDPEGYGFGV
jgi:hypothetical protein